MMEFSIISCLWLSHEQPAAETVDAAAGEMSMVVGHEENSWVWVKLMFGFCCLLLHMLLQNDADDVVGGCVPTRMYTR